MLKQSKTDSITVKENTETGSDIIRKESVKRGFFVKLFHRAVSENSRGRLVIKHPDGEEFTFGDPDSVETTVLAVYDMRFYPQTILFGDTGFGEAYMLGYWSSPDLLAVLDWFLMNSETTPTFGRKMAKALLINSLSFYNRLQHLLRPNNTRIAQRNISEHYDIGNELYKRMLDETMAYSSARFINEDNSLETAQRNKYEMICQKLQLNRNDHLLEIGSGWGGFARYAIENYGCRVTSVTISREQYAYVKEMVERENLHKSFDIRFSDYRDVNEKFDKIVSIEMIEAIGLKYHDTYFRQLNKLLKPGGIAVLQFITYPETRYRQYMKRTDFIQKHIFPGAVLLSQKEIINSLVRTGDLNIYDIESMGYDYARTLNEWKIRFLNRVNEIRELGYDQKFINKWLYYLDYCQAGFRHRYINVVQMILSHPQNTKMEDYHGIRY